MIRLIMLLIGAYLTLEISVKLAEKEGNENEQSGN